MDEVLNTLRAVLDEWLPRIPGCHDAQCRVCAANRKLEGRVRAAIAELEQHLKPALPGNYDHACEHPGCDIHWYAPMGGPRLCKLHRSNGGA